MANVWVCSALLTASIICIIINTSSAIKCWECRSDNDAGCADPFDNRSISTIECSTNKKLLDNMQHIFDPNDPKTQSATMCRKVRQKVHGVWRYFRGCAFLGEIGLKGDERFCLMRTGTYNIFMEYCTCNSKDGCNGSSHLKSSNGVLWVSLLSCYLLAKIFCQ